MACTQDRSYGFRRAMLRIRTGLATPALGTKALALSVIGALPAATSAQQSTTAAASLVFDGVTVVDVEHGKLVPDQRVVIAGNRIQAVGGVSAVKLPKDAQVVQAQGKYLIPGLWDMHVHTTADLPYPLLIASGVTGFRDAWSFVPLDTMVQWRREILAGTRVGPPRQLLTGTNTDIHQVATDELTVSELTSLQARGANFIKLYPFTFTAAARVRQVGLPFGGHLGSPAWSEAMASVTEASDSGITIVDHLNFDGGLDTLCLASKEGSVERCGPVAERFKRNGTWLVPTLVIEANLAVEGDASAESLLTKRAQRIFAVFAKRASEFWAGTLSDKHWLRRSDYAETSSAPDPDSLNDLRILRQVDMPMLAGTDIDVGPERLWKSPPGFALQAELAMLVEEGLTPLAALQSATLNPAKVIHGTDSLGTVAPGKLADLVLLDADPLTDITNTTAIRAVVANGRYFDRAALDQLLADVLARATTGFAYWWTDGKRPLIKLGESP